MSTFFESGTWVWIPDEDEVVLPAKARTAFRLGERATVVLENGEVSCFLRVLTNMAIILLSFSAFFRRSCRCVQRRRESWAQQRVLCEHGALCSVVRIIALESKVVGAPTDREEVAINSGTRSTVYAGGSRGRCAPSNFLPPFMLCSVPSRPAWFSSPCIYERVNLQPIATTFPLKHCKTVPQLDFQLPTSHVTARKDRPFFLRSIRVHAHLVRMLPLVDFWPDIARLFLFLRDSDLARNRDRRTEPRPADFASCACGRVDKTYASVPMSC